MAIVTPAAARRERAYVRVKGPDAEGFLQRMVSNDVSGDVVEALLLTPKGRVIAPLVVWRRGAEDFLLLTEPSLGDAVRTTLLRSRFAAKCEIESEEHTSTIVFGEAVGIPTHDYREPAVEMLDAEVAPTVDDGELERLRIEAGTPAWGKEIDETILPAEAGLDARAISYTKGCYPGQEPIARLHHRGHANRTLRVLEIEGEELPAYNEELLHDGKTVGRITSAARRRDGRIVALAYVRREVPENAELALESGVAHMRPA